MQIGPQVFLPLLSVLLVTDIVSGEQTGGTIKLLLTRPVSRGKILFGKYVTAVTATSFVNALFFAVLTGVCLLLFGSKFSMEPVAVGVKTDYVEKMLNGTVQTAPVIDVTNVSVISMQEFAIGGMLLTILASIAMGTLGFFCSVLVRSAAVSTGLSMGVVIIGIVLMNVGRGNEWMKGLITICFNLPLAWSGELSRQFGISVTLFQSLLVLFTWSVVMYGIGHLLFRRRDVLA
ncbi:ABC transporter permease [Effusibacillus consociatus]|uniref:ABC transporter permease n=1 Tax=Effusibacillus consociatus TaxID=1117041 RepID=A0ABV9PYX0_9BACL